MQLSRKHHTLCYFSGCSYFFAYGFCIWASSNLCSFHKEPTVYCTVNSLTFEIKKYPEIPVEDKMNKGFCRNWWCFFLEFYSGQFLPPKEETNKTPGYFPNCRATHRKWSLHKSLLGDKMLLTWMMEQLLCSSNAKYLQGNAEYLKAAVALLPMHKLGIQIRWTSGMKIWTWHQTASLSPSTWSTHPSLPTPWHSKTHPSCDTTMTFLSVCSFNIALLCWAAEEHLFQLVCLCLTCLLFTAKRKGICPILSLDAVNTHCKPFKGVCFQKNNCQPPPGQQATTRSQLCCQLCNFSNITLKFW